MTDEKQDVPKLYNLSRRRVLGGLGAIGLASAGAGLGTSAFFSDEETFENNVLTAGALDLVVDWEEHYSDWSPDEADGLVHDVFMSDPDMDGYVPFPSAMAPMLYLHEEDIDQFMANTALEAYPDSDDDANQDLLEDYVACADFAQLDENLDPTNGRGEGKRTENADTIINYSEFIDGEGQVDPIPAPLVNLHDVKPGDFGELTLSMHLCDNPGYIWLQGGLVDASENGLTEPESKDPDEQEGVVELLDEIQTMLWYDEDGDNVYEPGGAEGDAEVLIVLDRSGSMGSDSDPNSKLSRAKDGAVDLVNSLGDGASVGVVAFESTVSTVIGLTNLGTGRANVISAIQGIPDSGGLTNIEGAIDQAQSMLAGGPSPTDIMVLLSDGAPNVNGDGTDEGDANFGSADPADNATAAKSAGTELFTIGYDLPNQATEDLMFEMASTPKDSHAYTDVDINEVSQVFGQIGQIIAGEQTFFDGTLRELLTTVGTDVGIPLDGNRATAARDAFVDCTTNAIGLAWWLPVDHANEIQTDSVTFDLGFYTEQARHNDGSGIGVTPS